MSKSLSSSGSSPSASSGSIAEQEGMLYDTVKQRLERLYGYPEDSEAIFRVTKVDYCQSKLLTLSEFPRSRSWGGPNHDYLMVHVTRSDAQGKERPFCIKAEKVGEDRAGRAGIYIDAIDVSDLRLHVHERGIFKTWECFSIPIPLDVLIGSLSRSLDANNGNCLLDGNYSLLNKNCWDYSKTACKNVLLTLSKQPDATEDQSNYLKNGAEWVSTLVVEDAVQGAAVKGGIGLAVLSGVGALCYKLISGGSLEITESEEDDDV